MHLYANSLHNIHYMIVGLCGFLHLCCTVLKPWDGENCVMLEVGIGARISILYYFRLGYTKEDILKTIDPTLDVTLHELLQHYLPPHVIHSELDSYWRFDISMLLCYQFWIFKTNRLRFRFIYTNTLFISQNFDKKCSLKANRVLCHVF